MTVTPSNQTVEVTHIAVFSTIVSGVGVENFMYQWRHNEAIITGETGDTLMITNVMESDRGDYECTVTNQYGDTVMSNKAHLNAASKFMKINFMLQYITLHRKFSKYNYPSKQHICQFGYECCIIL